MVEGVRPSRLERARPYLFQTSAKRGRKPPELVGEDGFRGRRRFPGNREDAIAYHSGFFFFFLERVGAVRKELLRVRVITAEFQAGRTGKEREEEGGSRASYSLCPY